MKRALILGIFATVFAVLLLIRFFPPGDDFNLDNPFWNGLKDFKIKTKAFSLNSIQEIDLIPFPSETLLFIIGPEGIYTPSEVAFVSRYLKAGGQVILADDFGSGNLILEGLGLKVRFSGHPVVDPLFRGKAQVLVKVVDLKEPFADIESLMLNYPASLQLENGEGKVLATSSSFSFFDDNQNGKKDKNESEGPFPVIAEISYGAGKIYVVSDSSIFINSMLKEEGNQKFLKIITEGKKVLIDTSHHPAGLLTRLKDVEIKVYQIVSKFEIRYSLFLILVVAIVWLRFERGRFVRREEDIQDILQRHPDWDRDILNKLKKELEK